jgi:FtsH-binding integral membrane protein
MENQNSNYTYQNITQIDEADSSRKFIANVFLWMAVALGISTGFSWYFATDAGLLQLLINPATGDKTGLGTVVIFAPLAFVLIMSFGLNRLSFPVLAFLFIAFATLMGMSLSFIFLIYTLGSIVNVFATASLLFGVMAIAGYTTHQDLTAFGAILRMLLLGMLIAMLINWFVGSQQMDYIISFIGVAVFVGLTAYDVQKLKRIGAGMEYGEASSGKMVIMGALTLYLDFINMFLFLLRLFGSRK